MLTLRVSDEDKELLTKLVEIDATRNTLRGTEVSIASVVRGLIRREAVARGLLSAPPNDARDTPTP